MKKQKRNKLFFFMILILFVFVAEAADPRRSMRQAQFPIKIGFDNSGGCNTYGSTFDVDEPVALTSSQWIFVGGRTNSIKYLTGGTSTNCHTHYVPFISILD